MSGPGPGQGAASSSSPGSGRPNPLTPSSNLIYDTEIEFPTPANGSSSASASAKKKFRYGFASIECRDSFYGEFRERARIATKLVQNSVLLSCTCTLVCNMSVNVVRVVQIYQYNNINSYEYCTRTVHSNALCVVTQETRVLVSRRSSVVAC